MVEILLSVRNGLLGQVRALSGVMKVILRHPLCAILLPGLQLHLMTTSKV